MGLGRPGGPPGSGPAGQGKHSGDKRPDPGLDPRGWGGGAGTDNLGQTGPVRVGLLRP